MKEFLYNYHTHTKRCGHALGEDEEYVVAAIKDDIKILGFSDHIMIPGVSEPRVRGDFSQLENYLNSINYLKEKYKDQIQILVGFEAEYSDTYLDYYKYILSTKVDYLLLGQHNYYENSCSVHYFDYDHLEGTRHYVDDVIKGIRSGIFQYVCHPDLFMYFTDEWNDELEKESRRLLKACEEAKIPVELNICGMRRPTWDGLHHSYPNRHFYNLIKDYNLKIVLGIDAHNPEHFNKEDVKRALDFAKECGFEVDLDYQIKK